LFHDLGVDCKPNEESSKAGVFLAQLAELADHAGGEPPMPERPGTAHLDALRALVGNEQLVEILKQHGTLVQQGKDWSKLADLAAKRKPAWETLSTLLKFAEAVPETEDLHKQVEAVRSERRLLNASDPVPGIRKAAGDALRAAVSGAHAEYRKTHTDLMAALTTSENWKKTEGKDQKRILAGEGIADVPALSVGSEADLVRTLEQTSLSAWKTKTDALAQQFARAAVAAARLLEPKTQSVRLTSQTLKTEQDVKDWLAATEKELMAKLKDGPVVIS
ncbi:MAG: BREX system P-loop protein BrxC, partial [Candidatus Eisenbacteria sp.]|nr:BREX system P-loop protein BrxC [Candidatus Eisenbacteria bacterium]